MRTKKVVKNGFAPLRMRMEEEQADEREKESIKRLCDAVLASVDKEAVRALASRHSDGLPCEILSIERGSYNLSICLDFYNKISNRVLRIPLQPAVRDGWTKVQSEAATIE
ncbi:hypothetical protein V2A60_006222 [Cordyceps javanica]